MTKVATFILYVLAFLASNATAQTTSIRPLTAEGCGGQVHTVVHGDVVYKKFGPAWIRLNETNPGLAARTSGTGDNTVVMLYESRGDKLCIPPGMSVSDIIANTDHVEPQGKDVQVAMADDGFGIPTQKLALVERTTWRPDLLWWLPILLIITSVIGYFLWHGRRERMMREKAEQDEAQRRVDLEVERVRELTRNPVTSGPPIVAGGIPPNDGERLSRHFQDSAVAQYVRATPGTDPATVRPNITRIGDVEAGMISGEGMVGYADQARPRRINPAQPGYRARFRFPDGSERELMSLQGCMNPCYYGEGLSGFTFTARSVVTVPTPTPGPVATPHPAIAVARIRAAAEGEGETTILVGGQMMTVQRGLHFDLDAVPGSIKISGGEFDVTVKPKAKAKGGRRVLRTGTSS